MSCVKKTFLLPWSKFIYFSLFYEIVMVLVRIFSLSPVRLSFCHRRGVGKRNNYTHNLCFMTVLDVMLSSLFCCLGNLRHIIRWSLTLYHYFIYFDCVLTGMCGRSLQTHILLEMYGGRVSNTLWKSCMIYLCLL